MGSRGAASETHSALIQPGSVMFYLQGKLWVHPWTENPFMHAVKDALWGNVSILLATSLEGESRGSWGGLWRPCHFHTSSRRKTPIFPNQRVDSSFSSLWPKAFEHIWGRLRLCSGGKILKDHKFPNTEPYSRNSSVSACFVFCCRVRPPFSLVLWIEAYLYTMKSDRQVIIFSLKIMKIMYLKLPKLNGTLILLKIPSSTFKPMKGKI